jgi:4-hydroxy-2-oxoheptanedioate aldolase
MRENMVRTIWQNGGTVINGWLAIPNAWTAELMAHQGWDSLTVDVQHGLVGYETALSMLQAISTTATIPLARAPWNEPGSIMKLLDAGAYGIICPMINTRAEAEAFVGACRYAPQGYRSAGPTRASLYAGSDYIQRANATVVTMAMIETAEAVGNVADIVSVPGLDGIYIGPSDLSISLGLQPGVPLSQPRLAEAINTALVATQQHGLVAGIHTSSTDDALRVIEQGFRFVTIVSDSRLLASAAQAVVATVKQAQPAKTVSTTPY